MEASKRRNLKKKESQPPPPQPPPSTTTSSTSSTSTKTLTIRLIRILGIATSNKNASICGLSVAGTKCVIDKPSQEGRVIWIGQIDQGRCLAVCVGVQHRVLYCFLYFCVFVCFFFFVFVSITLIKIPFPSLI